MTDDERNEAAAHRLEEMLASIRLPLENLEFTLEQFLLQNGCRLDLETRILLAGVRDCVGRVAVSTRRIAEEEADEARHAGHAAGEARSAA